MNTKKYTILIILIFCCFFSATGKEAIMEAPSTLEVLTKKDSTTSADYIVQEQEERLKNLVLQEQQKFETRYYVLIVIIAFLIILFGILCFRRKKDDTHLKEILKLLKQHNNSEPPSSNNDKRNLDIDTTIVTAILQHLEAFEKEQGYLTSKITLHDFAKKLQTNTKYLSKVINAYKLKSFRSYINDLRINYSVDRLRNDSNYKKYTIKAMAKEAGFTSTTSFSSAFQKKTGTSVSNFIGQMNK